jgi:hypothetical protein
MFSRALQEWLTTRRRGLDEVAATHRAVGGSGPGRRRAIEQINHAYALLVSSQFQGFCRDLHTEVARSFARQVPATVRDVFHVSLTKNRKLDRGNPNPGNLGSDFGRFGIDLWAAMRARDRRNESRQAALRELAVWRNAIAHQDFSSPDLGQRRVHLASVRRWRSACDALARELDAMFSAYLTNLVGVPPW